MADWKVNPPLAAPKVTRVRPPLILNLLRAILKLPPQIYPLDYRIYMIIKPDNPVILSNNYCLIGVRNLPVFR